MLDLYEKLVRGATRHALFTVCALMGAFAVSLALYPALGLSFFPRSDAGQFTINLKAPTGSRLELTHEYVSRVEDLIKRTIMQTHARTMKETTGGIAAMVAAADEIRNAFAPEKDDTPAAPTQKNGDPAKKPFEVLDAGPVRVPYDPETGDMKGIANLLMVNADKIGGFVGKLYEKAVVAGAQAAAAQNGKTFTPPPSLPNGTATPNWPPTPPLPR